MQRPQVQLPALRKKNGILYIEIYILFCFFYTQNYLLVLRTLSCHKYQLDASRCCFPRLLNRWLPASLEDTCNFLQRCSETRQSFCFSCLACLLSCIGLMLLLPFLDTSISLHHFPSHLFLCFIGISRIWSTHSILKTQERFTACKLLKESHLISLRLDLRIKNKTQGDCLQN